MGNISGNSAALERVKQSYKNLLALGEAANGADFRMTVEGYPDLEYLFQSSQLPAMAREMIESKGPHGVMFNQQGNVKNAGDITGMVKEVVTGKAREALMSIITNKEYVNINIGLVSESNPDGNEFTSCTMEDSWIEVDPADLSVDDGATIVKLNITIHYNWVSWFDGEQEILAWE